MNVHMILRPEGESYSISWSRPLGAIPPYPVSSTHTFHSPEPPTISHNMNSQPENSSPVESQKDVIAVQSGSVENQKGAIAIDFVQQKHPSGSQWKIFELQ